MAYNYNTVHIFGYGETQVIGKDKKNFKVKTSDVKAQVDAVVANVFSQKPADSAATTDYHAVNIFNNMFADYQAKGQKGFRVKMKDLNTSLIDSLCSAVEDVANTTTTTTQKP